MAGRFQRPVEIFGTLGGLGLMLGVSVALGALLGWYLDGRWGTSPWLTLVGTLLGTGAGLYEVLTTLREYEEKNRGA